MIRKNCNAPEKLDKRRNKSVRIGLAISDQKRKERCKVIVNGMLFGNLFKEKKGR